ncbi:MAG: selenide, water dikinase SelD [Pseudorhodoplanes sp.]|uniref:selenide, water dikinase SelD n=1 Tax=Pseudorhodoplanes sp. TaxID=1934341 RepID=UPI003D09ECE8
MHGITPVVKDIVLVGAGHAHVTVLRAFGMRPIPGVRLTLITREVHTPYSGMLPGLIAGDYDFDEAHIDTAPLTQFAAARLYQDEVVGLDPAARHVICRHRPPVAYDLLSLDVGSTPNTQAIPGAAEYAIPVKPIDGFLDRFEGLLARMLDRKGHTRVAVVGAGAGGVELILSLERRLRQETMRAGYSTDGLSFTLIAGADGILTTFPAGFRARFRAVFSERDIAIVDAPVTAVEAGRLLLADLPPIEADEILWTTQAAAPRWLQQTGLPLDERGFLVVDASLRARGHDTVFAAGDMIAFAPRTLPKSGVYAVRAGPVLADNIRRTLLGQKLHDYQPQGNALYLVSTGDAYAIGTRNGFSFQGKWVWRWKDWIDRRFIRKFNELPEMKLPEVADSPLPGQQSNSLDLIRCGGCGAKVGAAVLSRALRGIVPEPRPDVMVGLDTADDAAIVDTGGDKLSVQTVDYFRAFIDDPYTLGRIAANHALGDIYAMGGEAQSAMAIATIPFGREAKVEADLAAMMIGANETLRAAGCALVGGHTSEGVELALGFAINGLVARDGILRKSGMRPGDALILTKPLGTGTLLAAGMRGRAKARWVMATISHMIESNRTAAEILRRHDVHAATDVTGFGLLGHLVEMVRASDVDATLALNSIPVLEGARETSAGGILSSVHAQNALSSSAIRDPDGARGHALYPLLFDPQTAGGLLASVPAADARACVAALRSAGYAHAAVIGFISSPGASVEHVSLDLKSAAIDA